jgi:hypothetical protein
VVRRGGCVYDVTQRRRWGVQIELYDDVYSWTIGVYTLMNQEFEFVCAFAAAACTSSSVFNVICNACIVPSGGVISSFSKSIDTSYFPRKYGWHDRYPSINQLLISETTENEFLDLYFLS